VFGFVHRGARLVNARLPIDSRYDSSNSAHLAVCASFSLCRSAATQRIRDPKSARERQMQVRNIAAANDSAGCLKCLTKASRNCLFDALQDQDAV
jgi:hypothetical protein